MSCCRYSHFTSLFRSLLLWNQGSLELSGYLEMSLFSFFNAETQRWEEFMLIITSCARKHVLIFNIVLQELYEIFPKRKPGL